MVHGFITGSKWCVEYTPASGAWRGSVGSGIDIPIRIAMTIAVTHPITDAVEPRRSTVDDALLVVA
jgi:hypothetical protein